MEGVIDGRVDPRPGTSDRIVLDHYTDTCHGCVCFGKFLFESSRWNLSLVGIKIHLRHSHILGWDVPRSLFLLDDKRT
jgi:hypothetical protein